MDAPLTPTIAANMAQMATVPIARPPRSPPHPFVHHPVERSSDTGSLQHVAHEDEHGDGEKDKGIRAGEGPVGHHVQGIRSPKEIGSNHRRAP